MRELARKESWPSREVPSKGGRGGTRVEYQPPPEVQRQIDEHIAQSHAGPSPAASELVRIQKSEDDRVNKLAPERASLDGVLLARIVMALEREFQRSLACRISTARFRAVNREAIMDEVRAIAKSNQPGDTMVEPLWKAIASSWRRHSSYHALIAAGIYDKAVRFSNTDRREQCISDEVRDFIRLCDAAEEQDAPESPDGRSKTGS